MNAYNKHNFAFIVRQTEMKWFHGSVVIILEHEQELNMAISSRFIAPPDFTMIDSIKSCRFNWMDSLH